MLTIVVANVIIITKMFSMVGNNIKWEALVCKVNATECSFDFGGWSKLVVEIIFLIHMLQFLNMA